MTSQRFYFAKGTKLPSNAIRISGSSTCSAGNTVTSTNCYAIATFYPATFWNPDDCTIGADCVLAPDGTTKLQRYEIRSGTYHFKLSRSGRNYVDEMQNFANWFQYYRKRKLMLARLDGQGAGGLTGLRVGVVQFNALPDASRIRCTTRTRRPRRTTRLEVAGVLLRDRQNGGTPTRTTL